MTVIGYAKKRTSRRMLKKGEILEREGGREEALRPRLMDARLHQSDRRDSGVTFLFLLFFFYFISLAKLSTKRRRASSIR